MSEITKEEIAIMIDVQSKSVANSEKIANSLKDVVDEQKSIREQQGKLLEEFTKGTIVIKIDRITEIVTSLRNLFGAIGVIVIVAAVIIKVFSL